MRIFIRLNPRRFLIAKLRFFNEWVENKFFYIDDLVANVTSISSDLRSSYGSFDASMSATQEGMHIKVKGS